MLALLSGAGERLGALFAVAAGVGLVALAAAVWRRQATLATATSAAGAVAWLAGNLFWLAGFDFPDVVSCWIAFVVATIAAERLELSRVLRLSNFGRASFAATMAGLALATLFGGTANDTGARVLGGVLLALAVWLARYDLARRTVGRPGLTGFAALALLSGYVWLALAGIFLLAAGGVAGGPVYDAILHAVFVGFAFAMIFGHAPIVFPAVLGISIPHRARAYVPLALLHLSLVVRATGDAAGLDDVRAWGAIGNAAAIALFLVFTATAAASGLRRHAG